ncbi:FAD binding domain-containing protein [Candidatus Zixiibacteriota bacterium]
MPIAHQFEYAKPKTLDEAIQLLAKHGQRAFPLAGGTDLIPGIRSELLAPEILVDIKGIGELRGIVEKERGLAIGALVTFAELIDSTLIRQRLPLLFEMAGTVASPGVRNRATMVGNICSAVPSCDSGPVLLVLEAEIEVNGPDGERKIPIGNWFLGPKENALQEGEIVTSVFIPLLAETHGGCYVKLGRYRGEDLAQASVAILMLAGEHYRIAFGAVAPSPLRASRIEVMMDGKKLDKSIMSAAQQLVPEEIAPITDIRASKQYREHMVGVMLERGLKVAEERFSGEGLPYGTSAM